jgi:hypothetical protein
MEGAVSVFGVPGLDNDADASPDPVAPASPSPDGTPILTRSVFLRKLLGVEDRDAGLSGRSRCVLARVGSELFCVISSRNAITSAASPGLLGVVGVLPEPDLAGDETAGVSNASRSCRNCCASWALDMMVITGSTSTAG